MIRSFIAVEIPDELKQALQGVQESFKHTGDRVAWVRPAGMHITLKFLGGIEEERISGIGREIEAVCAERTPFLIRLKGAGCFPDAKRPRILWAGIHDGAEELKAVFGDLEPRLCKIGFAPEKRPFRPHMTLGRIKYIRDTKGFKALIEKNRELEIGSMTAGSIHLVESRLHSEGAIYRSLLSVPFEVETERGD